MKKIGLFFAVIALLGAGCASDGGSIYEHNEFGYFFDIPNEEVNEIYYDFQSLDSSLSNGLCSGFVFYFTDDSGVTEADCDSAEVYYDSFGERGVASGVAWSKTNISGNSLELFKLDGSHFTNMENVNGRWEVAEKFW